AWAPEIPKLRAAAKISALKLFLTILKHPPSLLFEEVFKRFQTGDNLSIKADAFSTWSWSFLEATPKSASAVASACTANGSTSRPCWQAKSSPSSKTAGAVGSSLHALCSRILRPGAENLATPRQRVRHEGVTHLLSTFRYPCVRAGKGF